MSDSDNKLSPINHSCWGYRTAKATTTNVDINIIILSIFPAVRECIFCLCSLFLKMINQPKPKTKTTATPNHTLLMGIDTINAHCGGAIACVIFQNHPPWCHIILNLFITFLTVVVLINVSMDHYLFKPAGIF